MAVWANPEHWAATDEEIIGEAGVSRSTYYKAKQDPVLLEEWHKLCREILGDRLLSIYQASIQTACVVGRDGFQDRKLLLEMAGEYTPRKELTGKDGVSVVWGLDRLHPRAEVTISPLLLRL